MTKRLNDLEKEVTPSDDLLQEIEVVKQSINEYDSKVVDGIIVRSRVRWAEKGGGEE